MVRTRVGPFVHLAAGLCLLAAALSCVQSPAPRFLSIATGGTGGVYYPYGGAIARVISQRLPGVDATAEVTGASVDNLKLLQLGKVDLAFTLADTLAEARTGSGPFAESGAVGAARTLAGLYTHYTHLVATKASGIVRVADLRGRVVSVGSPGSGTELIADRLLAAAGLDPRADVTRHALGVSESAGALKDGKVDAFFWSGGLPTPAIEDLAATPGLAITLLPQDDVLRTMQARHGDDLYRLAVIPAGRYRGLQAEVPVVGATNLLVASSQLDEQLAYDIVRLLFEHRDELAAAHPEAAKLAVPTGPDAAPAPFHPGAIRYYREHGW
jgi:TRAP transporter TAXI family solute receptor